VKGFEVDPADLRRVDQSLGDVMQSALTDFERFEAQLAGSDATWGSDDLGMIIGEIYKGAYAMAMNCLYSNLDTLGAYSERLSVAADNYDAAEESISQRLQQIASDLDVPR
jgi:hypothetical protein